MKTKKFHVIIGEDLESEIYVGIVHELGVASQGETLDELIKNVKEATQLYLEETEKIEQETKFKGVCIIEVE